MRTVVLGLGNPILGDDGIGCRVVEELRRRLADRKGGDLEIEPFHRGGIALMERLIGHEKAILVDSVQGLHGPPGTLVRLTLNDMPTLNVNSSHDASLKAAIEMGRKLGAELPDEIVIFGVEIAPQSDFWEGLSPEVMRSVEPTALAVLEELEKS